MKRPRCENSFWSVIARGAKDGGPKSCMVGRWCLGVGRYVFFCSFFSFWGEGGGLGDEERMFGFVCWCLMLGGWRLGFGVWSLVLGGCL